MSGVWSPAMIDRVSHLWIEGKSAREIATEVGCGLSRNAIIGKVTRLGLQAKHRVSIPVGGAPKQAKAPRVPKLPRAARPATIRANAVDHRRTKVVPAEIEASREYGQSRVDWVEAGAGVDSPNARPFADASPSLCCWPLADGIMCCNPKARGAYCEGHARVAYIAPTNRGRTESFIRSVTSRESIDLTADRRVTSGRHLSDRAPSLWDAGRVAT